MRSQTWTLNIECYVMKGSWWTCQYTHFEMQQNYWAWSGWYRDYKWFSDWNHWKSEIKVILITPYTDFYIKQPWNTKVNALIVNATLNQAWSILPLSEISLRKLDMNRTNVDLNKLLELKSMTKLEVLNCQHLTSEEIQILRKQLPNVVIRSPDDTFSKLRKLRQLLSPSS